MFVNKIIKNITQVDKQYNIQQYNTIQWQIITHFNNNNNK